MSAAVAPAEASQPAEAPAEASQPAPSEASQPAEARAVAPAQSRWLTFEQAQAQILAQSHGFTQRIVDSSIETRVGATGMKEFKVQF